MGNFSTKSSVEEIIFVATVCKKESQKININGYSHNLGLSMMECCR
jgi:hypothetical protein